MLICSECLASPTARTLIDSTGGAGTCEVCLKPKAHCTQARELKGLFETVMDSYGRPDATSESHGAGTKTLAEVMASDGLRIFDERMPIESRNLILNELMLVPDSYAEDCWSSPFVGGITQSDQRWHRFASEVIDRSRYTFDPTVLEMVKRAQEANQNYRKSVMPGSLFSRARLHGPEFGFRPIPADFLGAPPIHSARAGRANPSGIPMLYVADTPFTAIAEIRPFVGGYVSVASCITKKEMNIFDLTASMDATGRDPFDAAFAREIELAVLTADLDRAFAQPVPPHTPERDYAPTQIVAETLKRSSFDGIKYRSEQNPGGFNYVFFKPSDFDVRLHGSFVVTEVSVKFERNTRYEQVMEAMARARAHVAAMRKDR